MKIMKRITTMLLVVCLVVPCFFMMVSAASGIIFFTDLETKVGDTFTVTGTVVTKDDVLGDATVEMSYDTSYIQFLEGDGVNADSQGNLTFTGMGDGDSDRLEFVMTFQALKEGKTRIEQDLATVTNQSGQTVVCENGYADISIGEGDPSKIQHAGKTAAVTIDGKEYTLSEAFTETEIPVGFTQGEYTYKEDTYKGAVHEEGGITAAYLIDSEETGKFWIYDEEKSAFYPLEEILISDTYSIIVLDDTEEVKMEEKYEEASIDINGTEFPAWMEPEREGFYILYAMNSDGEKALYLYDSMEHTYQRMEMSASTGQKNSSILDGIQEGMAQYLLWIVVAISCILVILLVLLIVTAVKLRHRNLELDDLYDEYGIDLEDSKPAVQPKKKNQFRRPRQLDEEDDYYMDDDDEYYLDEDEDDYDMDDEDDYYMDDEDEYYSDDEDLGNRFVEYRETRAESRDYDEFYDEDDFEEDNFQQKVSKRRVRKDDTFEMDFIDLE